MIHLEVDITNAEELLDPSAYDAGALLRWESSATVSGTYVEGGTIALDVDIVTYDIWDPAGVAGTWYRTRISDSGGTTFSAYSEPLEGGASPRATMAVLITRLRAMVGDPLIAGRAPTFTDEEMQDFLDERRTSVVEGRLTPRNSSGGYHDYIAPHRWWEGSPTLSDGSGATLTPDGSSLLSGQWAFTTSTPPPVFISGSFYDMYGSAQAVCETWAAKVAREFDFATDQQKFDRTGKREGLLQVAREYARKAVPPGRAPAWRSSNW